MKRLMVTSLVLLAGISGEVMAGCDKNYQVIDKQGALTALVSGSTVCANANGDRWQEQHRANGELWDYKKGPTDKVDPTAKVGTWSINLDDTVTYRYTGGLSYTYTIHSSSPAKSSPPYSFCTGVNGVEVVGGATFTGTIGGC